VSMFVSFIVERGGVFIESDVVMKVLRWKDKLLLFLRWKMSRGR